MKSVLKYTSTGSLIFTLLLATMMLHSCNTSMDEVAFFDRKSLPAQTIIDGHIVRSEEGRLQIVMDAPVVEKYLEPETKTVYPKGVKVTFYDDSHRAKAFFSSLYAESLDDRNIVNTRDSVLIIDYNTHDTIRLHTLVWDSEQHRIYSDTTVRCNNGARVTYGDSFESDENFENPIIVHQRGTIEVNE